MFKPTALLLAAAFAAASAHAQVDEAWPSEDTPTASVVSRAEVRADMKAQRDAGAAQPRGEQFDGEVAGDTRSAGLRYKVRIDIDQARASGAWPVREYDDSGRRSGDAGSRKATRHPRKEYPNVMGISLAEWLARQP